MTELTSKIYLAEEPSDCFMEKLRSHSNVTDYDKSHIVVRNGIGSPEECHEVCLQIPGCVLFIHEAGGRCFPRRDRTALTVQDGTTSGLRFCGAIYFEGLDASTGLTESATIGKRMKTVTMALKDGLYRVNQCREEQKNNCHVLIKYR